MNEIDKEIWERMTAAEQGVKSAHRRIDNIEVLVSSVREIAAEIKFMREDMAELKTDVDEIKKKPSKRYELIITAIVTAFASGLVGFFISKIFI